MRLYSPITTTMLAVFVLVSPLRAGAQSAEGSISTLVTEGRPDVPVTLLIESQTTGDKEIQLPLGNAPATVLRNIPFGTVLRFGQTRPRPCHGDPSDSTGC